MKLAFHSATTMTSDLETDIAVTARAGFKALEVWAAKMDRYLAAHSLAELNALFVNHNVMPLTINSIEFIAFRGSEFAQIKGRLHELGKIAQAIGCPTVVVVPSPLPDRNLTWTDVTAEYVKVLRDLSDIARQYSIKLSFEFLGFGWCSVRTPRAAFEIVQKVERDNVGLTIDAAHFYGGGGLMSELDQLDPARIFAFHLDDLEDTPKEAISDNTRLLPGLGVVPLDEICARLQRIGYAGPCSIELFRPEYWGWDPLELAVRAREAAVRVLSTHFQIELIEKEVEMTRKVKIAVIGTGRMGSVHCRNIVRSIPEADLVAVCDIRLEVAQAVADELGVRRVVKDYHDLLDDPEIEAILIASSTDTHAFMMKDVAAAGKHIFCEKPLALELEKIDEALAVVEKAGVKLQVGFNRRFDKSLRQVKAIVDSGEIGRPCILRITNRDPDFPAMEFLRVSGGIFLDLAIHDFDMVRYQLGEVVEVYAAGGVLLKPELNEFGDIDTDVVILKFANGAVGCIDNSRKAVYGYDQRLEVFCSNGTAMAENEKENVAVKGNKDGFLSSKVPYFFMQRYAPCYVEEVRQFVECVRDDKPTPTTGADGRAAVVLGYAAWKSLRENRPVKVSEIAPAE